MVVKRTNRKIVRGTRSVTLAVIAMLELLLLCVSLTFSWFERALDPILVGDDIHTAPALLSVVEVTENGKVDLSRYFDNASKAKFSPIHSEDGINFTTARGIELNKSEIHVAALSFEFVLTSDLAAQFWLGELKLNDRPMKQVEMPNVPGTEFEESGDEMSEEVTEEVTEEVPSEEITDETDSDDTGTDASEAEEPQTEMETETNESTELNPEETETETEIEVDEPETREPTLPDIAQALVICFNDGDGSYKRFTFAEASKYFSDGTETIFECSAGKEKTITCSIWLDYVEAQEAGVVFSGGMELVIDMTIESSLAETKTVVLTDETTMIDEMYPQMSNDGYYVELIDFVTGNVYRAEYDSELGVWRATVPASMDEFSVHYRSKGVDRDIIATWERIDGTEVHSFALYDEGVFLSSVS